MYGSSSFYLALAPAYTKETYQTFCMRNFYSKKQRRRIYLKKIALALRSSAKHLRFFFEGVPNIFVIRPRGAVTELLNGLKIGLARDSLLRFRPASIPSAHDARNDSHGRKCVTGPPGPLAGATRQMNEVGWRGDVRHRWWLGW